MLAARAQCEKALKQPALAATGAAAQQPGHDGRRREIRLMSHRTNLVCGSFRRDGVPWRNSQGPSPIPPDPASDLHCNGTRSPNMVGTNSETVGWTCIARCMTVYGAFAYMTSRMQ